MRASIRSRPWAGLDVGSFSVKVLATQGGVGGSRHWFAETLLGTPSDQAGTSPPEVIAKAIADCLPLLDDAEVGPALRFEARKHLPFDPQSMVIDFQILGRYPSERKLELLLAAVSQQHVEEHLAPLRMLGLEADILDAAPLALTNAAASDAHASGPHILLDIGHQASYLTVYQLGEPFFTRRIEFGGRTLTRAIAENLQVPFDEAEEWKLAAGSDQPGLRLDWDSPEMRAVQDSLKRDLVDELRRSFAFYRTQARLPEPTRIMISGGSARLPGLATRLGEMLGEPVVLFNPFDSMSTTARGGEVPSGGPQFAQALGLALRSP